MSNIVIESKPERRRATITWGNAENELARWRTAIASGGGIKAAEQKVGFTRKFANSLQFWLDLARDRKVSEFITDPNFRDRLVNHTSFDDILAFCRQAPISSHEVAEKKHKKARAEAPQNPVKHKRRVNHKLFRCRLVLTSLELNCVCLFFNSAHSCSYDCPRSPCGPTIS